MYIKLHPNSKRLEGSDKKETKFPEILSSAREKKFIFSAKSKQKTGQISKRDSQDLPPAKQMATSKSLKELKITDADHDEYFALNSKAE